MRIKLLSEDVSRRPLRQMVVLPESLKTIREMKGFLAKKLSLPSKSRMVLSIDDFVLFSDDEINSAIKPDELVSFKTQEGDSQSILENNKSCSEASSRKTNMEPNPQAVNIEKAKSIEERSMDSENMIHFVIDKQFSFENDRTCDMDDVEVTRSDKSSRTSSKLQKREEVLIGSFEKAQRDQKHFEEASEQNGEQRGEPRGIAVFEGDEEISLDGEDQNQEESARRQGGIGLTLKESENPKESKKEIDEEPRDTQEKTLKSSKSKRIQFIQKDKDDKDSPGSRFKPFFPLNILKKPKKPKISAHSMMPLSKKKTTPQNQEEHEPILCQLRATPLVFNPSGDPDSQITFGKPYSYQNELPPPAPSLVKRQVLDWEIMNHKKLKKLQKSQESELESPEGEHGMALEEENKQIKEKMIDEASDFDSESSETKERRNQEALASAELKKLGQKGAQPIISFMKKSRLSSQIMEIKNKETIEKENEEEEESSSEEEPGIFRSKYVSWKVNEEQDRKSLCLGGLGVPEKRKEKKKKNKKKKGKKEKEKKEKTKKEKKSKKEKKIKKKIQMGVPDKNIKKKDEEMGAEGTQGDRGGEEEECDENLEDRNDSDFS